MGASVFMLAAGWAVLFERSRGKDWAEGLDLGAFTLGALGLLAMALSERLIFGAPLVIGVLVAVTVVLLILSPGPRPRALWLAVGALALEGTGGFLLALGARPGGAVQTLLVIATGLFLTLALAMPTASDLMSTGSARTRRLRLIRLVPLTVALLLLPYADLLGALDGARTLDGLTQPSSGWRWARSSCCARSW